MWDLLIIILIDQQSDTLANYIKFISITIRKLSIYILIRELSGNNKTTHAWYKRSTS